MDVVLGEDDFSRDLADKLDAEFVKVNNYVFPDSELKPIIEDEEKVKGRKVLLVMRTNRFRPSVSDCLMKIYFLCRTLNRLDCEISLFLPWMFYSRQDKKFLPGEPESLSNMADFYESLEIKNIFTVNSHLYGKENPLQSYFKEIKIHDISTSELFADYLKTKNLKNPIVLGPGTGPAVMVKELAKLLNVPCECLEKGRNHATQKVIIESPKTNLKDRDVIIYDDISATGGTIIPVFNYVKNSKPNRIFIALSHIITREGIERLYKLGSDEIITTDSFASEESVKFTELSLPTFSLNLFNF